MKFLHAILLCFVPFLPVAFAAIASPHAFQEEQPDGSVVTLKIVGDTGHHHVEDEDGYTVMRREDDDWLVYADEDEIGEVKPSGVKAGRENPREYAIKKNLVPPRPNGKERRLKYQEPSTSRNLAPITKGKLNNLVVLLRFADHKARILPSASDINILFNKINGHPTLAPSGSIRDIYRYNSYRRLNVISKVMPWITLPKTEAYYADNNYGDTVDIFRQALYHALDALDNNSQFNYKNFDTNNDGVIDAITFLHSGYGSEYGATDCYGQKSSNRIWSHMSGMSWQSKTTGVEVNKYHISPSVWDTCGHEIGRVGVIAHELGHFLGLPDLYDTQGGSGIGNFDLMCNCWGFDGSQYYPPVMSAWSRIKLNWIQPRLITRTKNYRALASAKKPIVYKIEVGFPQGEYLLIENRQPYGYDKNIPHGGLAIWHIDENAAIDEEGFPGQAGWSRNGKHYRVALLQADGLYELEKSPYEQGDGGDLFYLGGKTIIGPSTAGYGPYPNTDAYQGGNVYRTGITIRNIRKSGYNMMFRVIIGQSQKAPRKAPMNSPMNIVSEDKLETTFQGGLKETGCMFDIVGKKDLVIRGMSVHLGTKKKTKVEVWTKLNSFDGYENDAEAWEKVGVFTVYGNDDGMPTELPFDSFTSLILKKQETKAFYVTLTGGNDMLATITTGKPGKLYKQTNDLKIFSGTANKYPFGQVTSPRIWNGGIFYDLPKIIKTKFNGESGQAGIMFDIKTHKSIIVMGMELNVDSAGMEGVQIWTKQGSHVGSENKEEDWISIGKENMSVEGRGEGFRSRLEPGAFSPIDIAAGSIQAFYVTLKENKMRYSYGDATGDTFTKNEDLEILVGTGVKYSFGETFTDRVWNGVLNYAVI